VSEQEQEQVDHLKNIQDFVERWESFSITIAESPGPLYTAGIHAILAVIRKEAATLRPSLEGLKKEIEELDDEVYQLSAQAGCGRC